jgi:GNAT superfamily N-acetyltransferase
VAPRFVAYAAEADLFPALSALGVNVHVTTQPQPPPRNWVKSLVEHPVHRIRLDSDFEGYWRQSGQLKKLKQARRRTQALTVEIDARPAAEWIIRGWADYWRTPDTSSWEDLIVASEHYRKEDRFHTIRLLDGGEPVSGSSFLVENGGLLFVTTYTKPEYRRISAGARVLDIAFAWAADSGFKHMDVGVGHAYKRGWAPESAMRWSYDIRPWHVDVAAALARRARAAVRHAALPARSFFGKNSLRLDPSQTNIALDSSGSMHGQA